MKKCTLVWREARFEVKSVKTHHVRSTSNVEMSKSARRCGAEHISKSKCTKHAMVRALWEIEVFKKRAPLWSEAHVEVKMYKTRHARNTFGS